MREEQWERENRQTKKGRQVVKPPEWEEWSRRGRGEATPVNRKDKRKEVHVAREVGNLRRGFRIVNPATVSATENCSGQFQVY